MVKKKLTDSIEPAEAEQTPEAILPAESIAPAPQPIPAPQPAPVKPSGPNFWQRLGRAFLFLMRVTILLFVIFTAIIFIYIGIPFFYDNVIAPIQNNTNRIVVLEAQAQTLDTQLAEAQAKITSLETQLASLDTRTAAIEKDIASRTESITTLEEMLKTVQASQSNASAELNRQIKLLKSMELISRARLFLYQSNFGLAEQDVSAARSLLAEIQPDAPAPLNAELIEVLDRVDGVISYLPEFPVAAISDLDLAWQILISGIPQPTP